YGAIPLANPRTPRTNIVAREYRVGGGTRGNVASKKINQMRSSLPDIETGGVGNLVGAGGGSDDETMVGLKCRAAASLRHRDRAVTADDFEALAKEAANIGRAETLPLFHPSFPEMEIPGVVTV